MLRVRGARLYKTVQSLSATFILLDGLALRTVIHFACFWLSVRRTELFIDFYGLCGLLSAYCLLMSFPFFVTASFVARLVGHRLVEPLALVAHDFDIVFVNLWNQFGGA